ncbi:transport between ER and Golgi ATPase protein [Polyrhizophydium stewartii]|uniref:Vesicular-fusion protein SEC18 n=1 Tax=Polyrhizophydium stewartii TaxID=2732419 RepID=A0ABR4N344_9FUNG
MRVRKHAVDADSRTGLVYVSPVDFPPNCAHVLIDETFAFSCRVDQKAQPGEILTGMFHRTFARLSVEQDVRVRPYDPLRESPNPYLGSVEIQVGFARRGVTQLSEYYDVGEMSTLFTRLFNGQIFSVGQATYFDFQGVDILATVVRAELVDLQSLRGGSANKMLPSAPGAPLRGILIDQTVINFTKTADSTIRLKGGARSAAPNAIFKPNFNFADLGIGGLDDEFSSIFRRAFVSRIFPPAIVQQIGIQHVKGIVLYGPPGTGKTLMARQIGKMLNAREPLIVNGPEILNKFVGQSEENIRKLFAPAEAEYKAKGEESSLHIIIFDELDAICKQRGSKNDGTGVGDSIVNQLLSKMDGVDQLNNILIIGMTNRLDMIDEALLRPGRLEIQMEIHLPDEKGRLQILNVHTAKMRKGNLLDADVDLAELASLTKNFSGAEIAGLIKSASSFAFNRHIKIGDQAQVTQDYDKIKFCRDDFLHALEEVRPAFGVSETELQQCVMNGILKFGPNIERILSDGQLVIDQVKNSQRTPLVSVLLHGPVGAGKTALAATIAMSSEFPFIKLISPESMVGFTEAAKMSHISKVFNDAYKSPLSCVVVDSIERLLDWASIGPRFSNSVLQTLLVLFKKPPPKGHKLLILATTSQRTILEQLELIDSFNSAIYVPTISTFQALDSILVELRTFSDGERVHALRTLEAAVRSNPPAKLSIPIKKLLYYVEMAAQDVDKVDKFVQTMTEELTFK